MRLLHFLIQYSVNEFPAFFLNELNIKKFVSKNFTDSREVFEILLKRGYKFEKSGNQNKIFYQIKTNKIKIYLRRNTSDFIVFKEVFLNGGYAFLLKLVEENKWPCNNIIDAGANIGLFTLCCKASFPRASVIALEPETGNYFQLKKNILANELNNTVSLQNALWFENTTLFFNNLFRDGRNWAIQFTPIKTHENIDGVKTKTVSEIMKKNNWSGIDIFKIDIEGAEKSLFLNDKQIDVWLPNTKVIAIEIHDEFNCRKDIENILKSYNFDLIYNGELTIGVNSKYKTK
ncbi:MAG TPA: FkbM family methyltransferase [Bacteroidales bacterium]|nr:FkbM family methyltransferase [Bacteroidales bacterium]HPS15962.1 FkbM family methyltransferase [Bacteroidales bacterium]